MPIYRGFTLGGLSVGKGNGNDLVFVLGRNKIQHPFGEASVDSGSVMQPNLYSCQKPTLTFSQFWPFCRNASAINGSALANKAG